MERYAQKQAKLELTLLALGRVGHAFEQPEGEFRKRDGLMRRQALLGPRHAHAQVFRRPQEVAAPLEMDGELGGDLGQAFRRGRFERFGDGQV
jgi:hypothetical protein